MQGNGKGGSSELAIPRVGFLSFVQGKLSQQTFPSFMLPSWQRKNGTLALSPRNAKVILSKGKKLAKVKNKVVNKQVGN